MWFDSVVCLTYPKKSLSKQFQALLAQSHVQPATVPGEEFPSSGWKQNSLWCLGVEDRYSYNDQTLSLEYLMKFKKKKKKEYSKITRILRM